jgi:hypothetical protein
MSEWRVRGRQRIRSGQNIRGRKRLSRLSITSGHEYQLLGQWEFDP